MLIYIQSAIALILGIVSAITDFRDKKIYNKNLLILFIISCITYMIFIRLVELDCIFNYSVNLFISIIVSFCFFYFNIWAAGDAKLFIAIIFMIPFEVYEVSSKNIFPALNVLIIIFSVAFLYIVCETIYLWIKDKKKIERLGFLSLNKYNIKDNIILYFMGYFLSSIINSIAYTFFEEFSLNNSGMLVLCIMLTLMFVYRVIQNKIKMYLFSFIFLLLNLIYYLLYGFNIGIINIHLLLIVIIIMLFRRISEEYNYEEIKIDDLKPRMILSYASVLKFYGSRVKGLPSITTENTDSRLTEEEVESIKRWSKTKNGTDTIVVVRHMPFAPFMFIGELIFFLLKIYC